MKRRGRLIYFGEDIQNPYVKVHDNTPFINGHPLFPPYSTDETFCHPENIQKSVEESLALLDPRRTFEENAQRVAAYLEENGLNVRREDTYGDVLVETDEGYGVVVLFNEKARINTGAGRSQPETPDNIEDLLRGFIIVDKGFFLAIPEEEAAEIEKKLDTIYASQDPLAVKVKKIQSLLGIPEESARNLLK